MRFDRVMVVHRLLRDRKIRRLTDGEFRAFVAMLALAGDSPLRGVLLVTEGVPLTADDVADEAGVDVAVAESAMTKLQQLGTLVSDGGPALRFRNWSRYNPDPRPSDRPEAWRERKRRQRERERQQRQAREQRAKPAPTSGAQMELGHRGSPLAGVRIPSWDSTGKPVGRARDRQAFEQAVAAQALLLFPHADQRQATEALTQAIRTGARNDDEVRAFVDRHWPQLRRAS